jgi:argininosuccinate synthase
MTQDYDAVALYSGGTDSTLAPLLARPHVGDNVLLLMIDLGEPPEAITQAASRAEHLSWPFQVIDGRAEFAANVLAETIRFRGNYWGYPLGTPLGRAFQCRLATDILTQLHAHSPRTRYLIHGCSARQNTRFRIERSCDSQSEIVPVGPLVTATYSRPEKIARLEEHGIASGPSDNIARDENIFCKALEGDALNNLSDPASLDLYTLVANPKTAPDEGASLSITFENGAPVALNGDVMPLHELVATCRTLGATHGVGRICMFEDTVPELGYKERSIFESPASAILYAGHRYIEAAVLNHAERELIRDLRHQWARLVYRGSWFTSERTNLAAVAAPFHERIAGTVDVSLWKGNILIGDAVIPNSVMLTPGVLAGTY